MTCPRLSTEQCHTLDLVVFLLEHWVGDLKLGEFLVSNLSCSDQALVTMGLSDATIHCRKAGPIILVHPQQVIGLDVVVSFTWRDLIPFKHSNILFLSYSASFCISSNILSSISTSMHLFLPWLITIYGNNIWHDSLVLISI